MSVHPDAVDPRLVLNEAMLKRAAKRLKAAWPTSLKLTQAYQAFAQILGFDSLEHLQRAKPSLPVAQAPDVLADLANRMAAHMDRHQTLQAQLNPRRQVVELGDREGEFFPPLDLGRLGAQLDAQAGGWWSRLNHLEVSLPEVTLVFIAKPTGLVVTARRLGWGLQALAATLPPGLHELLASHVRGTVLHLGVAGSGKSSFIHAISKDRQVVGHRVALLDPQQRMDPAPYREEDYFSKGTGRTAPGFEDDYDLLVIGSHMQMNAPGDMVARYRSHRPNTRAITLERPHASFLEGLTEWMGSSPSQGYNALDELHGVILHQLNEAGVRTQTFLTRSALAVLGGTPRSRWDKAIEQLSQPDLSQTKVAPVHFEAPTGFDTQPWSPSDHQRLDQALDRLRQRSRDRALAATSGAWRQELPHEALREALLPTEGPLGGLVVHAGGAATGKSYWAGRVAKERLGRQERVAVVSATPHLEDTYPLNVFRPNDLTNLGRQISRMAIDHVVFEDGGNVEPPLTSLSAVGDQLTSGLSVAMIHHAESMLALVRYWWTHCPAAFDAETSRPIRALIYHHRTETGFAADVLLRGHLVRIGHYLRRDPLLKKPLTQRAIRGFIRTLNLSTPA